MGCPALQVSARPARAGGAAGLGPRPPAGHRGRARGDAITTSRRPSPGPMPRMPRSSKSTPRLGRVAHRQYVVAHDCGTLVNPLLAEGQIVGGAAQGIGGALLEESPTTPTANCSPARSWITCCRPRATSRACSSSTCIPVAAQPARRQGRRRRRRHRAAGGDRQCGLRRARPVRPRVQPDADPPGADRAGHPDRGRHRDRRMQFFLDLRIATTINSHNRIAVSGLGDTLGNGCGVTQGEEPPVDSLQKQEKGRAEAVVKGPILSTPAIAKVSAARVHGFRARGRAPERRPSAQIHSVDAARRPSALSQRKAGIDFCRGHRLSPV